MRTIAGLRADKRMTQEELAKAAGVKQATVSRFLSGDRNKAAEAAPRSTPSRDRVRRSMSGAELRNSHTTKPHPLATATPSSIQGECAWTVKAML